ncbi:hypothetical protein Bsel_0453 [[Bacillus] selenitireducens MLS10]|uniref:Uncharacterized protein n=1 Tax=Bacillus selenitireducens (strain ATCC 700615 / DSM 15326 / MLS10) TaxID=439292 RepID=D6XXD4_BACIE|nr:hypothetical protein Bsel_0453 [[Bacillus] selenitireducens MLS10]
MNVDSGRYFFSASQVQNIMNLCSVHDHQAVDSVLCRADAAMDNRFFSIGYSIWSHALTL